MTSHSLLATARTAAPAPDTEPDGVVILCPNAWTLRNVVHAGTLRYLRNHGGRAHLLTPDARPGLAEPGYEAEEWTRFGAVRNPVRLPGKAFLDAVIRSAFHWRYGLRTASVFDPWNHRHDGAVPRTRRAVVRALARAASRDPMWAWQRGLEEWYLRRAYDVARARRQLEHIAPALVVSTNSADGIEIPYILAARDLGIPTLGCVLSFDNLTSRSVLPVFDHYAVWNERMRDQVLRLYPDRDPACIHVTGSPQFDFHHDPAYHWERGRTLRFLSLDPDDRYLVYAANSAPLAPSEPASVEVIARRLAEDDVLGGLKLVIRLHPLDDFARWERLERVCQQVRISRPWRHAGGTVAADDQAKLVSTLLHADVCLSIASTISLDCATLDRPAVCVSFAVSDDPAEHAFMRNLYESDHYLPITVSGGVRMAPTLDATVNEVREYVLHPERDRTERARLADAEGGWRGSPAAPRLAACIARVAGQDEPARRTAER